VPAVPVLCFLALVIYVLADGFRREFNLTHLLFTTYGALLVLIHLWAATMVSIRRTAPAFIFYVAILFLALTETVIVLLQVLHLFPVPSRWFMSTGTWINPNVTAMFIALSYFAAFRLKERASVSIQRYFFWPVLALMALALATLQCRSAWLAALLIWMMEYKGVLAILIRKYARMNWKGLLLLVVILMAMQALYTLYSTKEASALSRTHIWRNSLHLIAEKPWSGYGFGMFEKEYNWYAASTGSEANDHVSMAYNDFLELAVEGGIPACILYLAFLVSLFLLCWKIPEKRMFISVILAILIIQLTNFGFQAIPVMALLLVYAALAAAPVFKETPLAATGSKKGKKLTAELLPSPVYSKWWVRLLAGTSGLALCALLFLQDSYVMIGYYRKQAISQSELPPEERLVQLQGLYRMLQASPSYYEYFGDLQFLLYHPEYAVRSYKLALTRSSDPELLLKTGYCYQRLSVYDSSEYYFKLARGLQPHRFMPRLRLLQLYAEKQDTTSLLQTANSILQMPVKVRSNKVSEIQQLARSAIGIYDRKSAQTTY
jgi:O-antigen ligase